MGLPTFEDERAAELIDARVIELLKKMLDGEVGRLDPYFDPNAKYGYGYPDANVVLKRLHGEEVEVLELLHKLGYLEGTFYDKVYLCPFCQSHHLHLRLSCPECNSTDIRQASMLHHFSCGHVDLEERFLQRGRLVCPKCSQVLRHIGVDYERPSRVWTCNQCGYIFQHPVESFHCHRCGRQSSKDQVVEKRIYSFTASPEAAVAIEDGKLYDFKYYQVVSDGLTQLVNMSYFREQGLKEVARSVRYGNQVTFVLTRIVNFPELVAAYGQTEAERLFRDFAQITNNTLRSCDLVARYDDVSLIIQLPETGPDSAIFAINRISYNLTRSDLWLEFADPRPKIKVSMVSIPEDAKDYDELLKLLEERIETSGLTVGMTERVGE